MNMMPVKVLECMEGGAPQLPVSNTSSEEHASSKREVHRGPLEHVVLHSEAFPRQCEEYGCVFDQNGGRSSTK